jgi:hypothetical protein
MATPGKALRGNLRVASAVDIQSLESLGFPETATSFSKNYEPDGCVEIGNVLARTFREEAHLSFLTLLMPNGVGP